MNHMQPQLGFKLCLTEKPGNKSDWGTGHLSATAFCKVAPRYLMDGVFPRGSRKDAEKPEGAGPQTPRQQNGRMKNATQQSQATCDSLEGGSTWREGLSLKAI